MAIVAGEAGRWLLPEFLGLRPGPVFASLFEYMVFCDHTCIKVRQRHEKNEHRVGFMRERRSRDGSERKPKGIK